MTSRMLSAPERRVLEIEAARNASRSILGQSSAWVYLKIRPRGAILYETRFSIEPEAVNGDGERLDLIAGFRAGLCIRCDDGTVEVDPTECNYCDGNLIAMSANGVDFVCRECGATVSL
jgi:hypothetical protein